MEEGFIQTRGGKVWYGISGKKSVTPLLVIHGGPGYPHDSLTPLADISNEGKVIFYDQLGCGNSQKVGDKSLWSVEYFLEELNEVVKQLKLKKYYIVGHSWGAALGAAHAAKHPKGLRGLILADPYLSTPIWEKDVKRLLTKFPKPFQKALLNGDPETEKYKQASKEFYAKHLYRMKKLSTDTLKAEFKMNVELYNYMWGPEEFDASGTLRDFDLTSDLPKINVPTLIICGRFDEATPESAKHFQGLIKGAKLKVFEKSAHMPHWTEREEYIAEVRKFLNSV